MRVNPLLKKISINHSLIFPTPSLKNDAWVTRTSRSPKTKDHLSSSVLPSVNVSSSQREAQRRRQTCNVLLRFRSQPSCGLPAGFRRRSPPAEWVGMQGDLIFPVDFTMFFYRGLFPGWDWRGLFRWIYDGFYHRVWWLFHVFYWGFVRDDVGERLFTTIYIYLQGFAADIGDYSPLFTRVFIDHWNLVKPPVCSLVEKRKFVGGWAPFDHAEIHIVCNPSTASQLTTWLKWAFTIHPLLSGQNLGKT